MVISSVFSSSKNASFSCSPMLSTSGCHACCHAGWTQIANRCFHTSWRQKFESAVLNRKTTQSKDTNNLSKANYKTNTNAMVTDSTASGHRPASPACFFQRRPSCGVWYLLALLHAAVQVPNSSKEVFFHINFLVLRTDFVVTIPPLFGQLPQSYFPTPDGFCLMLFRNHAQQSWPKITPETTTNKVRVRARCTSLCLGHLLRARPRARRPSRSTQDGFP